MKWVIIGMVIGIMTINSAQAVEWKEDCQIRCENGKCNTILGKTAWINDTDNSCKGLNKANNIMKHFNKHTSEYDFMENIDIVNANYSCITILPYIIDVKLRNKNIPIKVNGVVVDTIKPKQLFTGEETLICVNNESEATITRDGHTWGYSASWIPETVLDLNFTIGEASTTIQLQDANTENLDDGSVRTYSSRVGYEYGACYEIRLGGENSADSIPDDEIIIKFNTSKIPIGQTIDGTTINMYVNDNDIDAGERMNHTVHHVYEFPDYDIAGGEWTEGNGVCNTGASASGSEMNWADRPSGSLEYNTTSVLTIELNSSSPSVSSWVSYTVTDIISSSYVAGEESTTIWFKGDSATASAGTSDDVDFDSKEGATSSRRPYLNITYSEAEEPPPSNCWSETADSIIIPVGCEYSLTVGEDAL